MHLSDSEWKIAECLWKNKSMTLTELTKELASSIGWNKSTIITLLKRMIEKGAVTYVQKGRTKIFCPAISKAEVELEETNTFLKKFYKGNVGLLISNLLSSDQLSEEQVDEIRRIIEEE